MRLCFTLYISVQTRSDLAGVNEATILFHAEPPKFRPRIAQSAGRGVLLPARALT